MKCSSHRRRNFGRRFGMGGGQNQRGSGVRSPPAGSRGRASVGGLGWGTKSPRRWIILKVVTSKFYAFLVVFYTFSSTHACFSVLAGIIPLSLQNRGGDIWYRLPPCLQVGGGQLPPLPPAPPPMLQVNKYSDGTEEAEVHWKSLIVRHLRDENSKSAACGDISQWYVQRAQHAS